MSLSEKVSTSSKKYDLNNLPDWAVVLKGTNTSIVVPPYIRFLKGILLLRKALVFLQVSKISILDGRANGDVKQAFEGLESSRESKSLGLTYETYFASHLTINLVSEVEHFFGSAVSVTLSLYPKKMSQQTFKLSEIIDATSTEELIDRAANSVLNDLMYEKPLDYIKKLAEILSIETDRLNNNWLSFVELKARRDLGIHNNWIVNEIYIRKLKEAKYTDLPKLGEKLLPNFDYMVKVIEICNQLVDVTAELLSEKWVIDDKVKKEISSPY